MYRRNRLHGAQLHVILQTEFGTESLKKGVSKPMIVTLDLHVHSAASYDGRLTPAQIVATAQAAGLNGVAICDHDVMEDLSGVELPAGFVLIPGVEYSTDMGHILGLFLQKEAVFSGRSAVAAIDAIHAAGGLAVLAHPFQHSRDADRLEPLIGRIDGVEVFNARAARKIKDANDLALAFCERHKLSPFAGSDAHVAREIGNGRICVEAPSLTLGALCAALLRGGKASGQNSRHIDVAKSQKTKLRKRGAGPAAYGKWLLFAGKCAFEDLWR